MGEKVKEHQILKRDWVLMKRLNLVPTFYSCKVKFIPNSLRRIYWRVSYI